MARFCQFKREGVRCLCVNCNAATICDDCRKCYQTCTQNELKKIKLGDTTERILMSLGVTQERWVAAKKAVGLAPTCTCSGRKKWLNNLSDWISQQR